jgi:hypothetical protein
VRPVVKFLVPAGTPPVPCKGAGCDARIHWVKMPSGKNMPVDADGTPHWATCVDSKEFKEKAKLEKRLAELRGETKGSV